MSPSASFDTSALVFLIDDAQPADAADARRWQNLRETTALRWKVDQLITTNGRDFAKYLKHSSLSARLDPGAAHEHARVMKLPVLSGVVRRRILANYRMDPDVAARWVPAPLRPKLQGGHAIAGVCLIRLEDIKPQGLPCLPGITSENAAHRIAVEWDDADGRTREGVFIERRDSDSWLNQLAGGRIFPGRHGAARFDVDDDGRRIGFRMQGEEGLAIAVDGVQSDALPSSSVFADLREASAFFEGGSLGYSRTDDPSRLDGMQLVTDTWTVAALALDRLEASFFEDGVRFPRGSVVIDHALVMRDIGHRWVSQPDLACPCETPS